MQLIFTQMNNTRKCVLLLCVITVLYITFFISCDKKTGYKALDMLPRRLLWYLDRDYFNIYFTLIELFELELFGFGTY